MLSVSLLLGVLALGSCTTPPTGMTDAPRPGAVILPDRIDDPLEPINRGVWAFNEGFMDWFLEPVGKGYRTVVPQPVRKSVTRFGYNLGYPGRALNQLLQGRVEDAGDESLRFATNTTVGLLGFFDVASKWQIPKHRGNFAQTFAQWGWRGESFLVLPLLGPSDEMHATGVVADRLADPMSYHDGARAITYAVNFNDRAEQVDDLLRIFQSDPDAYSTVKYIWTYQTKGGQPDWTMHGPQDPPTLETLAVATLNVKDPAFMDRCREAKVRIEATGKKLPFNYWLQDKSAPLVYVVPGLGSHRLTMQALSVAENLYRNGYSVVCISGLLHPEFIEIASGAPSPGYAPDDRRAMASVLGEIDRWLTRKHAGRLGERALVGCSMGGFQALALAADQRLGGDGEAPHFSRYVAINPPVDLHYALERLDRFMEAPLAWPEGVRRQRVDNAIHKVVAMVNQRPSDGGVVPIDAIESKLLIGMAFRLTLRNAIFTSQRRCDQGLLREPLSKWRRSPVYDEIMQISFADYFRDFIVRNHTRERGASVAELMRDGNLRKVGGQLAKLPDVHVITSRNDFLLSAADIAWLERTFGPRRLVLLDRGGHMGALASPGLHDLVASRLQGLKAE